MKKKIATLAVALLVLFPKTSRADLDVLSIVQDNLKVFQEKASTIIQGYVGIQVNLQEIALNRDMLGALRDTVKDQVQAKVAGIINDAKVAAVDGAKEVFNRQLSSVTLPGLNTSVSLGPYTSPVLKQKVAKSYVKRKNQKSDVVVNVKQDDRNNRMMVENLAIIYSNALVKRKQLLGEAAEDSETPSPAEAVCNFPKPTANGGSDGGDDSSDNSDVSILQYRYVQTACFANYRWLEMLRFESTYRKALSELYMTTGRVDDIAEIVGTEEKDINAEGLADIGAEVVGERKAIDLLALKDQWDSGKNAFESGDYAGALSAAGAAYGIGSVEGNQNIADIVKTGTTGAGNVYNAAKDGNWGDVVNSTGHAVGDSLGGNTGSEIGATGSIISGGMGVISSGGNANDVFDNFMTDGRIQSGLSDFSNLDTSQEDAIEKAKQEEAERMQQKMREDMAKAQQEMKQQQCQSCKADAEKAGRDPNMSCLATCM